jgi:hypothetical protein
MAANRSAAHAPHHFETALMIASIWLRSSVRLAAQLIDTLTGSYMLKELIGRRGPELGNGPLRRPAGSPIAVAAAIKRRSLAASMLSRGFFTQNQRLTH